MEGIRPEDHYQVALPEFEGPLDLLLHLVKRHELNIFDIPISFITDKYLEYLDLMRQLNLDIAGEYLLMAATLALIKSIAGEYLLMAATLALIKSKELLPREEEEEEEGAEEEEDPREELIRRLLEYQKYKEAAGDLASRPALGRQVFRRGSPMEPVDPSEVPLAEVSTFALISALAEVLKRSQVKLTHDVIVDRISISDRINELVDQLSEKETVRFAECFTLSGSGAQIRHEVVVTFLAILEMARLKMIRILQQEDMGEIFLSRTESLDRTAVVQDDYA